MIDDGKHSRETCDDISSGHLVGDPDCHIVGITRSHPYKFYLTCIEHLFLRLSICYIFCTQNPPSFLLLECGSMGIFFALFRLLRVRLRALRTALATGAASSVASST